MLLSTYSQTTQNLHNCQEFPNMARVTSLRFHPHHLQNLNPLHENYRKALTCSKHARRSAFKIQEHGYYESCSPLRPPRHRGVRGVRVAWPSTSFPPSDGRALRAFFAGGETAAPKRSVASNEKINFVKNLIGAHNITDSLGGMTDALVLPTPPSATLMSLAGLSSQEVVVPQAP